MTSRVVAAGMTGRALSFLAFLRSVEYVPLVADSVAGAHSPNATFEALGRLVPAFLYLVLALVLWTMPDLLAVPDVARERARKGRCRNGLLAAVGLYLVVTEVVQATRLGSQIGSGSIQAADGWQRFEWPSAMLLLGLCAMWYASPRDSNL